MFRTETDVLQGFLQGNLPKNTLRQHLRALAAKRGLAWGAAEEARFLATVPNWGCN